MKYSLLKKIEEIPAVCSVIYDISADRAIKRIEPDERKADFFLKILSEPLTEPENIAYRQDIMKDFISFPGLLSELKKLLTRYDRIKTDWQQSKLYATGKTSEISSDALLEYSFASLKSVAGFPSTIRSFFSSIGETISRYTVYSNGLKSIRDYCLSVTGSDEFRKIEEISLLFRHGELAEFNFDIKVRTDSELIPYVADLSSVSEIKAQDSLIDKIFLKKKKEKEIEIISSLSDAGDDPYSSASSLLCAAFTRLDNLITETTGKLYDSLFGLSSELVFYEVASKYCSTAENDGSALTYPNILSANHDFIFFEGLSELLLLSEHNGKIIVKNDLPLENNYNGLIVRGMTDSGKTVYLRAIAAAQLFAQAGLPVLAEKATVSIRYGFFSHFSSAEEDFLKKNARGRFDQEASELAKIISSVRPYSLLLLNETFQTTSYKEGTESIFNILKYMPLLKTKYVFVTHLVNLFDYMQDENVLLAQTSDSEETKYKITFINKMEND